MQVVYHGSYIKVDNPKILIGQFTKDFGNGFYCTILKEQARKWSLKYKSSVVNIYEYHENNLLIPHDILIYLKFSTMHSIGQV